uniref:Surfactant protein C n=1 Tax=Melopsittacus undulatus TaxID=13146 RepID=A0A8C6ITG2_MELUD
MDGSSKEALMEEAPPRYTASPRQPCTSQLTSLLMAAVVMLILTVVIVTFLLLGLHITETHTEAVRGGSHGTPQHLSLSKTERTGTFSVVRMGLSMTRLCPKQLLVGYRSWRHSSCCITRMDPDSIPGLDTVTESFQRRQVSAGPPRGLQGKLLQEDGDKAVPLADRSILGTSINILCSTVPVYWA